MLNFKLKDNAINGQSETPLADYLHTLGITEVDDFIYRPNFNNELDGALLDNAIGAVCKLKELFEANKKMFLIVDCDTDGFTSAAIFYNYFKYLYPDSNIQWMLHEEKQHGIEMDKIPNDVDVVIVPDAGSNQLKELTELNNRGIDVIVMDHHEVSVPVNGLDRVIIVNNQTSKYFPNKALSGAGVVFKIIKLFDTMFYHNRAVYYYDLAALGIIADCMDSRTLDNNCIIYRGLQTITNKMFKALLKKQAYAIPKEFPNKLDVAFYIAPLINGTIRMGTMEDKEKLFRGFIEEPTQAEFEHTWRGTTTMEDFYQHAARIAYNVKNEQNRKKMQCLEFLRARIEAEGLHKNQIIAVIASDTDEVPIPKTITGLVAMELLKLYGKPSLVLRPTTDEDGNVTYSGSGRSKSFEELPSFLQFIAEQEESVYAQGHACAFGTSIKANEYEHFIQSCNEKMAHIDFQNDCTYVDAIFNVHNINHNLIYDWASGQDIYGNSIPQPLVAITATITKDDIRFMGTDGTSVRITINGMPCIKLKDKTLAEQLQTHEAFNVQMICKTELNEFRGVKNPQLRIEQIDVKPLEVIRRTLF